MNIAEHAVERKHSFPGVVHANRSDSPDLRSVPPFAALPLTLKDVRDLRSDHAGEHGAVAVYAGILAVTRNAEARKFAQEHQQAERRHLAFFNDWLPTAKHSRLLPVWYAAGWLLGATAALFGPTTIFRTIAAVESFVERHYGEQIERMRSRQELESVVDQLQRFCAEEVAHRDDAAARLNAPLGLAGRLWISLITRGSGLGVAVARRI